MRLYTFRLDICFQVRIEVPGPWPSTFLVFFPGFTGATAARGHVLCGQLPAGGSCAPGTSQCPAALPPEGEPRQPGQGKADGGSFSRPLLGCPVYLLLTSGYLPPSFQGPIRIGAGCFVSGLDTAHSEALHGLELHDLILQGHHVRLHGSLSRVFTLAGRLDSWEVGTYLTSLCLHL